ncbi:MAG: fused MFS/spermidine synthase [Candidatus Sedimenticola endophacoides]
MFAGGAYTQPRAVKAGYPGARITVAELDEQVTETARRDLYLDDGAMTILHGDARVILRGQAPGAFDVVVTDVFHDISVPYHLVNREYAELVRSRLAPGGLYTLNLVDLFPDPRLVKSLLKTLRQVFRHVHVWVHELPREPLRMTFVVSASDGDGPPELIRSGRGLRRGWMRVTEPLGITGTPLGEQPLLRDDYVPVERLVSSLLLTAEGK